MQIYNTRTILDEYTANSYFGIEKTFGRLSLSLSTIAEYYKFGTHDSWSIYPSMQATYIVKPSHILQFAVSTNKEFPKYREIQEDVSYINGYAQLVGNPDLVPAKLYSVQGTYICNKKYISNVYYNRTNDYFMQAPYQSSDELKLIYQTVNFEYNEKLD